MNRCERLAQALAAVEGGPVGHVTQIIISWGNFRGRCSCGWEGPHRYDDLAAVRDDVRAHKPNEGRQPLPLR